jgi:acyl dehydratase
MTMNLATMPLHCLIAEFNSKPITGEDLALYARASGDLNPLHLERAFAQQAGFEDVIVHGMLGMAFLGRLLSKHFPPESLRSFSARFAAAVPVGSALHCRAHLAERNETTATLALEGVIASTGVVAVSGTATIALPITS